MIIPIEPAEDTASAAPLENGSRLPEKGFVIVADGSAASPRQRFERRAEEIALAAELHVRRMLDAESRLLYGPGSAADTRDEWTVEPETRDTVPFGLKRRVVLRVPVFSKPESAEPSEEVILPEDLGLSAAAPPVVAERELGRVRTLVAQLALDLIARLIEINRYFAEAGLVKAPEDSTQEREGASAGKTMSDGSEGFSLRRRA
jgi:hypothetical protein